jgi:nucleotide-binding universal stress UspA family protein
VCFGRPADEILAFADKVDADLVAMSAHGRSGLSRWVFGSVADRVLRGSVCPVLLVRPEIRLRSMSSPWSGVQTEGTAGVLASDRYGKRRIAYRRILVPLDGSELAEQVLPYVKPFIDPSSTRVFLIRVLTTGIGDRTIALLTSYPPGLQLATTVLHRAELQLRTYLRSVAAVLREEGAIVHTAVRRGSPADEILAYAAEVDADILIMTTHGLSGLSRWVYGNVAGRVLQGAQSPVLLVRPRSE